MRKKIPWHPNDYVIDEANKDIWLVGSFMRAMALRNRRTTIVPGYEVKLCTQSELEKKKNAQEK